MSDLDTSAKRQSSVQILLSSTLAPPFPTGTIDQAERQHVSHTYAGVISQSSTPSSAGFFNKGWLKNMFPNGFSFRWY